MTLAAFALIVALMPSARAMARQADGEACPPQVIAASDGGAFDSFGYSTAIDGDVAVTGAIWDDDMGYDAGAAYVFRRKAGVWTQEQKLVASDGEAGDEFGRAVSIHTDRVLIGAPNAAAAYVFEFDGSAWIQTMVIPAPDDAVSSPVGHGFGRCVAVHNDVAIIGASRESSLALLAGAAYVFRHDGTVWVQEQKLLASDGAESDAFGMAVAIKGDWILVGAPDADGFVVDAGAVYAFNWNGSTWIEEQKLIADDPGEIIDDHFGWSVCMSSSQVASVLIGDPNDHDVGWFHGSAYVFNYDGEKWVQVQEFYMPEPAGSDTDFGRSVSIDGDRAVVGAPFVDTTGNSDGAAYVYRYDAETELWELQEELLPSAIPSTSFFGWSVAISEGTAIIGAHGEFSMAGSAYLFDVAPAPGGADLDCDGVVGPADLAELLAQWGECAPKQDCPADISPPPTSGGGDGMVNPADLAELLANWG